MTQNGTLTTCGFPFADDNTDPAMLLLFAGASLLMHACQQAWFSDYLPDAPLVDIVAAVIGLDPFN